MGHAELFKEYQKSMKLWEFNYRKKFLHDKSKNWRKVGDNWYCDSMTAARNQYFRKQANELIASAALESGFFMDGWMKVDV